MLLALARGEDHPDPDIDPDIEFDFGSLLDQDIEFECAFLEPPKRCVTIKQTSTSERRKRQSKGKTAKETTSVKHIERNKQVLSVSKGTTSVKRIERYNKCQA